ncbi:signal peptidase I [Bacteroidia bacterium]|nr:signal peptidase I [Bacteroidia bacterium]
MEINKKRVLGWIALIAGILFLVWLVRTYCVGSYRISTPSMENALHTGDYVLVNKFPDQGRLKHNGIFLFTSPLWQDRDDSPLLVSRCIALPGDTIEVSDDGYTVNGVLYPRSPYSLSTYVFSTELKTVMLNILKELDIPLRSDMKEDYFSISLSLTSFEEYRIREELTVRMNELFARKEIDSYKLVVPRKDVMYELGEGFLTACREAIRMETNDKAEFRDYRLFLDNEEVVSFSFSQDYYWLLSDNINAAVDSRYLGFISYDHIIGNAWFCWYSKDKERSFKKLN